MFFSKDKKIEGDCLKALESVREKLDRTEYSEAFEYISNHREWLLGLETAIDFLSEKESTITEGTYLLFVIAFKEMGQKNNTRIRDLRGLVFVG